MTIKMEPIEKLTRRNSPWSILLLVLALGIFTACEERPAVDEPIVEDDEYAVEETGPSVSDITSNPESYEGQTVTLQGEVGEMMDSTTFRLSEGTFGDGLLVVVQRTTTPSDQPNEVMPMEGEEARVRGTIALMTRSEIEQQYQVELDEETGVTEELGVEGEETTETEERQAVLIAESVTRASTDGAMRDGGAFGADRDAEAGDDRVARDSDL